MNRESNDKINYLHGRLSQEDELQGDSNSMDMKQVFGFAGVTAMFIVGWYVRYKRHKKGSHDMTEGTGK